METRKSSGILESQESLMNSQASPTVDQLVKDTHIVCEELLKMRSELASQSCLLLENAAKDVNKEREIVKVIQSLQSEILELNLQIDSALVRIQDKEEENILLKQNIDQAKLVWEKKSESICECCVV